MDVFVRPSLITTHSRKDQRVVLDIQGLMKDKGYTGLEGRPDQDKKLGPKGPKGKIGPPAGDQGTPADNIMHSYVDCTIVLPAQGPKGPKRKHGMKGDNGDCGFFGYRGQKGDARSPSTGLDGDPSVPGCPGVPGNKGSGDPDVAGHGPPGQKGKPRDKDISQVKRNWIITYIRSYQR